MTISKSNIEKNKSTWNCPCLATFEESTTVGPSGVVVVKAKVIFTFYQGRGKVAQVRLSDPPQDVGYPILKAILDSQVGLEASCADIFPIEHECPGKMPDGTECKGKSFGVTLDRRNDGIALLRLKCSKCGAVILQDIITLDTRLLCLVCGEAKPTVRLANDPQTSGKMRMCDECYGKRSSTKKEEEKR